ncbi:MAG TPA: SpoIIE family protein phosphatase, partial [Clostridia bacterium]|nr:SpoIIE family protein phosphatase [Clostridia bacterium]
MKLTHRKIKFKLRNKIALLFILLIVISVAAVGTASVIAQYNSLIDDTGKRLTSLAHYAASHINGDDLKNIKGSNSEKSEAYQRVQKELRQVLESANKMPVSQISELLSMEGKSAGKNLKAVYSYMLIKDGATVSYGADAFSSGEKAGYTEPCTVVSNKNQIMNVEQIYSGVPYFASEPYKDKYGTWITGYARVFDSDDNIAGVVCVDASIEFIYWKAKNLAIQIIIAGALLIIAASLLSFYLSKRITNPLTKLNKGAEVIGNGDLDYFINVKTGDEIEDLAYAFNNMTSRLKENIENLKATTAEKERIQSELKIAQKIQTSMLPRIFPPFPERKEFSLFALMEPAKEVGGDFYDFFLISENKLCFVIGDVSGKGVPAALFMVIAKTLIKNQALSGCSAAETLFNANNLLCMENEEMMFVTVFIGILNTETGEMEYSNAGHNPPLICRKGGEFEYIKPKKSFVLAGMENFK